RLGWPVANTTSMNCARQTPITRWPRWTGLSRASRTDRRPSAWLYDKRLEGPADRAGRVVQHALGKARARAVQQRARVQADPLATGLALQVDREVRVDEQIFIERQCRADA